MRLGLRAGITATLLGLLLTGITATSASAASWHTNTLPYETGCGGNVYRLSSQNMGGGTATIVYSRTCGTNWIEYYGPARETVKNMWTSYGNVQTWNEWDYTRWAYSRQVYAPGNSSIVGFIQFVNSSGYRETWEARCSSACNWVRTG